MKHLHSIYAFLLFCGLLGTCQEKNQDRTAGSQNTESKLALKAFEWPESSPEDEDFPRASLDSLVLKINAGDYGNIDHLLIVKDGKMIFNEAFPWDYEAISRGMSNTMGCGTDACEDSVQINNEYNYLHPKWHPFYKGQQIHTLQSVTKSVAATLIGIALHQGKIESLDQPVISFFEDYDLTRARENFPEASLKYLLSMQLGMEWHETDRPLDSTNTTLQLEFSQDWIQFTLNQPKEAEPGEKWVYNSGASHLMSGIIKKSTGQFMDEFAEENLFTPLNIQEYHWKKTPKGYPDTEGGLYLKPEDLAKIGQLYLQNGFWQGQQILSEAFVQAAISRQAETGMAGGLGYGYQWWRIDRDGLDIWAGLGFGGQRLLVIPSRKMVAVYNSWNIFDQEVENMLGDLVDVLVKE